MEFSATFSFTKGNNSYTISISANGIQDGIKAAEYIFEEAVAYFKKNHIKDENWGLDESFVPPALFDDEVKNNQNFRLHLEDLVING